MMSPGWEILQIIDKNGDRGRGCSEKVMSPHSRSIVNFKVIAIGIELRKYHLLIHQEHFASY